jgi:CYTH domain-containing protein
MEIERKFLLERLPPAVGRLPGKRIRQGYLAIGHAREVRIRMIGGQCWMTVKQGAGLVRQEIETRIARGQFEQLWPVTEGLRIEKTRYALRHRGRTVEIDIYGGALAPLQVAEVEFPSIEASERFTPPDYFGEEVTDREDYRNAALALYGLPEKTSAHRIGALPYLFKSGRLHIVLVTNAAQSRWILPKGHTEKGLTRHEVALMESVEEAGVIGTFARDLRAECRLRDGTRLHVYPLLVSTLLHKWPEASVRKRQVLPLEKAAKLIADRELAECVLRLGAQLQP